MRSVALVLGALPPFEGPWVPISEGIVWDYYIKTHPIGLDVDGQVRIELDGMYTSTIRFPPGLGKRGSHARAIVGEIEGLKGISVYLEEADDES